MEDLVQELEQCLTKELKQRLKMVYENELAAFRKFITPTALRSTGVYASAPSFCIASCKNPPLKGGMVDLCQQLNRILSCRDGGRLTKGKIRILTTEEMNQIPKLLTGVLKHLDTYYTYQVFRKKMPYHKIQYCDALVDPALFSKYMLALSSHLLIHSQVHLIPLLKYSSASDSFRALIFDNFKPKKRVQALIRAYQLARVGYGSSPAVKRPSLPERFKMMENMLLLEAYRARHQWLHFAAPLWDWCSMRTSKEVPKSVSYKGHKLSVVNASSIEAFLLGGTSTMDHIWRWELYGEKDATRHYTTFKESPKSIGVIVLGILFSINPKFYYETVNDDLMRKGCWFSLLRLYRSTAIDRMVQMLLYAFDEIACRDPRSNLLNFSMPKNLGIIFILYTLIKENGPNTLRELAERSWHSTRFAFLYKRLIRYDQRYPNILESSTFFSRLYTQLISLSDGSRKRYITNLVDDGLDKLRFVERMGCENVICPGRIELKALARRVRREELQWENLSKQEMEIIKSWGCGLKLCGRCKRVAYCSRGCQKADWKFQHSKTCRARISGSQRYLDGLLIHDNHRSSTMWLDWKPTTFSSESESDASEDESNRTYS